MYICDNIKKPIMLMQLHFNTVKVIIFKFKITVESFKYMVLDNLNIFHVMILPYDNNSVLK